MANVNVVCFRRHDSHRIAFSSTYAIVMFTCSLSFEFVTLSIATTTTHTHKKTKMSMNCNMNAL